MRVSIQLRYDSGIPDKLEILKLEHGISINEFIVGALVEKLQRDGYLPSSYRKPKKIKKPIEKKPREHNMTFDMEWIMRNRRK